MNYKSILLLFCSAAAAVSSNVILRIALQGRLTWTGSIPALLRDIWKTAMQPIFFVAALAFVLANLLWVLVVSSQKLSIAFPVQIGLVVVFNAIITTLLFDEKVAASGYLGMVLIVIGVVMLVK